MGRPPLRLGRPKGRPQAPFQPSHENRYPFTNWSTFAPPKWSKFTPPLTVVTAAVLFLVLHGIASLAAHPDYLAYFNEMGRGREHRLLSDSNLDWGQDLGRLSRYLRDHGIQKVYVDCFGRTSPETVGIRDARPLSPSDRPLGWIAVSLTKLQGVWPPSAEIPYAWLLQYEPRAKIGKTIWLYYFEP